MKPGYNPNLSVKALYENILTGVRPSLHDPDFKKFNAFFPIANLLINCWHPDVNIRPNAVEIVHYFD
jgi:hypothetical protein